MAYHGYVLLIAVVVAMVSTFAEAKFQPWSIQHREAKNVRHFNTFNMLPYYASKTGDQEDPMMAELTTSSVKPTTRPRTTTTTPVNPRTARVKVYGYGRKKMDNNERTHHVGSKTYVFKGQIMNTPAVPNIAPAGIAPSAFPSRNCIFADPNSPDCMWKSFNDWLDSYRRFAMSS